MFGERFLKRSAELSLAAAMALLTASTANAAPSPSPARSLESGLVAPSDSAFVEASKSANSLEGPLTATQWAGDDVRMLDLLRRDHFVSGYARTWLDGKGKRAASEAAAAFDGQSDALNFLAFLQPASIDTNYVRPTMIDSIDSFVGAHYADPKKPDYWDEGVFVKGNDLYAVYCEAQSDTLGDLCPTLAKAQFAAAPQYTIPPAQWPENASTSSAASSSGPPVPLVIGVAAFFVLVLLAMGGVLVVLIVRRRGPSAPAPEAHQAEPQMSADGRYWWDGQAWRDADQHVPAGAMRSPDGYYWWDGRGWRAAPRPG